MFALIVSVLCLVGLYLCLKELDRIDEEESWEEIRSVIEQVEFIQKVREETRDCADLRREE